MQLVKDDYMKEIALKESDIYKLKPYPLDGIWSTESEIFYYKKDKDWTNSTLLKKLYITDAKRVRRKEETIKALQESELSSYKELVIPDSIVTIGGVKSGFTIPEVLDSTNLSLILDNRRINDGSIIATGSRQAVYNNGGTVEIGGTAYLESQAAEAKRGTVHNYKGNLIITGGTIKSTTFSALKVDAGSAVIGSKDSLYDKTNPVFIGNTYGMSSAIDVSIYDANVLKVIIYTNNI
mgnify:CR=1 FL=1